MFVVQTSFKKGLLFITFVMTSGWCCVYVCCVVWCGIRAWVYLHAVEELAGGEDVVPALAVGGRVLLGPVGLA